MPLRIVGKDNLRRVAANRWSGARSIGRTKVRPLALALVVREGCIEFRLVFPPQTLRIIWVVHDIPEGVIVLRVFRLPFAQLDDWKRIVSIGTDVCMVDQFEDS